MLQGTGSDVGKSTLVAGLCRALRHRGYEIRPFKPQNMSNNAAVTIECGEIGRAQALQARACGIPASIHMNPVLLKPQTDIGAQVIVQGQLIGNFKAREYQTLKPQFMAKILESFGILTNQASMIVVEGAGSTAEVNLRTNDIANMGFAEAADLPVILVGDIDRGGVIAQLVGTHALLSQAERDRVCGFIINKFRGDSFLFQSGIVEIEKRTNWPCLGLVPWFQRASDFPAEDAMNLSRRPRFRKKTAVRIAVCAYPRISNFDDFDPLIAEPSVEVEFIREGTLPNDVDLLILPGSKATIADLTYLKTQGWDIDLQAHLRRGGHVMGICGGLQMLGLSVSDPEGVEGESSKVEGLGVIELETILSSQKILREVKGYDKRTSCSIEGYEMHLGQSHGPATLRPMLILSDHSDGVISEDGCITGTYVHGLFASDDFRAAFLKNLKPNVTSTFNYEQSIEQALDQLAEHLEENIDVTRICEFAMTYEESMRRKHG